MDQTGKVANPACGQLNRKAYIFPVLSPFAPENLISQDRFGRPVPRQPAHSPLLHTLRLNTINTINTISSMNLVSHV